MKFILLLTFYLFSQSLFADEKLNACFITINSSEEKHLFKEHLSTGKNAGKFEFHEFVPFGETENDHWFENACEKKIRCDILVISGHFGGSFFGESGFNLSMSELETRSCKNDCKGLLSDPKEVFLLGCNTLAGKKEDNRSASEYLSVLLDDDIPLEEASRIVEQRYGAVGTSFSDSMRRAFKGVPHIYGFHSVGPSGKSIKRLLDNYHEKTPDYSQHLLEIEVKRALALMNDFTKWNQKNDELAEALKITYFAQTSGVLIPCVGAENIAEDDPTYELLNNICKLRSDELYEDEALAHITNLLLRDDFAVYLPVISDYLEGKKLKEEFKNLISTNPIIKEKIIGLLKESKTGFGKLQIATIAMKMDIISNDEFLDIEKNAVLSYLKHPVSVGSKDAVCGYDTKNKISIKKDDLDEKIFTDLNGLAAIGCLEIDDRELVYSLLNTAKQHKNLKVRKQALISLMTSKVNDSKVIEFLSKQIKNKKNKDERAIAFYVLSFIDGENKLVHETLDTLLESDRKVNLVDTSYAEYALGFYAFNNITFENLEHLEKSHQKYLKHGATPEMGHWLVASAASKLPVEEQVKYFEHERYKNNESARVAFYEQHWEKGPTDRGPSRKMDIKLLPYVLEDIKRKTPDDKDFYIISRINADTAEKQAKILDEVQKLNLSDEGITKAFSYIVFKKTDERLGPAHVKFVVSFFENKHAIAESIGIAYLQEIFNGNKPLSKEEKKILATLRKANNYSIDLYLDALGVAKL